MTKPVHLLLSNTVARGVADARFQMQGDAGDIILEMQCLMDAIPELRAVILTAAETYHATRAQRPEVAIVSDFNGNNQN